MRRSLAAGLVAIAITAALSGCANRYATTKSDTLICVYDGGKNKGEKLKFSVPPGGVSKKIGKNDKVVEIPASNRFYRVSADASRDPGAPESYLGYARNSIVLSVQGQVRFRFKYDAACDWYAKHGRRNLNERSTLDFNKRGDDQAGWFLFLNENFADTMRQAIGEVLGKYDWTFPVYNYPTNADESGNIPVGTEPGELSRVVLGRDLGEQFTKNLNANLGGQYFCGIDKEVGQAGNECPAMRFQIITVQTTDVKLMQDREKFENTKQALRNATLEGQLQEQNGAAAINAENAKQAILQAQLNNARTQAQIARAECLELARAGLDCEGKRAPIIVGGAAQ